MPGLRHFALLSHSEGLCLFHEALSHTAGSLLAAVLRPNALFHL